MRQDEKIIRFIFNEHFNTIRSFIQRNKGTVEDAEDVFQDAIVIIYQKARDRELSLECSFKTFLYSVCRHVWLQKLEKSRINPANIGDIENFIELSNVMMYDLYDEERERVKIFQQHFLALGEDCQKLLRLFMRKTPLSEIMKIMGYKSVKYTKTRKFLCKERLKKRIKNDPRSKNFMINE